MNVTIVQGDLLDQDVDVIVNAWNRNTIPWWLLLPQGVSGAIKRRGGTGPFKELRKHGPIPLGGALLTSAGRLPYKGIIHVAGINMLWRAFESEAVFIQWRIGERATKMKSRLGTAGTVKDGWIDIQGDHRDRIVQGIEGMGYRAKIGGAKMGCDSPWFPG